jgi:hypothetical protein
VDTSSISQIVVTVGSTPAGTDILNGFVFNYDQTSGLPSGMNYVRAKGQSKISLTLGTAFVKGTPIYGQYTVLNKTGTAVLTKKFTYK